MKTKQSVEGLPMMSLLQQLSKNANWFWWEMVKQRNEKRNTVVLRGKDLSATKRKQLTAAMKEFTALDLIKRVRREHYMINPNAFLPIESYEPEDWEENNYLSALEVWNQLP